MNIVSYAEFIANPKPETSSSEIKTPNMWALVIRVGFGVILS